MSSLVYIGAARLQFLFSLEHSEPERKANSYLELLYSHSIFSWGRMIQIYMIDKQWAKKVRYNCITVFDEEVNKNLIFNCDIYIILTSILESKILMCLLKGGIIVVTFEW